MHKDAVIFVAFGCSTSSDIYLLTSILFQFYSVVPVKLVEIHVFGEQSASCTQQQHMSVILVFCCPVDCGGREWGKWCLLMPTTLMHQQTWNGCRRINEIQLSIVLLTSRIYLETRTLETCLGCFV